MHKIILIVAVIFFIFFQTSADMNITALEEGLATLREIQNKIMQREIARVDLEDMRFEENMDKFSSFQRKYLTHTWNVFSSLTAYMESVLEKALDGLVKPRSEDLYFQEITSYLEDIILKSIDANTQQCQKVPIKRQTCDLLKLWPTDCSDVIPRTSGITRISHRLNSYLFYCEQDLFDGGWTLFWQSDLSFFIKYRNMTDVTSPDFRRFIQGFGKPCKDHVYTLGLEMVHQLTFTRKYQLLIYYEDVDGTSTYSHFEEFAIGSALTGYNATVLGPFFGNATENIGQRHEKKFHPYGKRNLLMGFRSWLPERDWGTVKMLLRPSEIKLNVR